MMPTEQLAAIANNIQTFEVEPQEQQPVAALANTGRAIRVPIRRRKSTFVILLAALVLGVSLICLWISQNNFEETDDAYVTGHPHQVSSRIENVVEAVLVDDNDHVDKGQILVRLDPRDYELEVAHAQARVDQATKEANKEKVEIVFAGVSAAAETAQANGNIAFSYAGIEHERSRIEEQAHQIDVSRAELAQAEAQLTRAELDCKRFTKLEERGVVTTQQKENAVRDFEVCKSIKAAKEREIQTNVSRCQEARSSLDEAKAKLSESFGKSEKAKSAHVITQVTAEKYRVAEAAVAEARSELNIAKSRLAYCNIYAPVSGRIGKRTVEIGHRIEPGQQLMHVVEDYVWVVANFKETQVRHMVEGQIARIKIDSIPDKVFTGVIDSFSPGSGASFALLPPDNAIGNFTKIVQRVPVKIRFNSQSLEELKRRPTVGFSASVKVNFKESVSAADLTVLRRQDSPDKKIWAGHRARLE